MRAAADGRYLNLLLICRLLSAGRRSIIRLFVVTWLNTTDYKFCTHTILIDKHNRKTDALLYESKQGVVLS